MKCEKSGNHTISYQSLLLSTTVLNDIHAHMVIVIYIATLYIKGMYTVYLGG